MDSAPLVQETSIDYDFAVGSRLDSGAAGGPRLSSISFATRSKMRSPHSLAPDVASECESVADSVLRAALLDPARLTNAANMTDSYCNLLRGDNGARTRPTPSRRNHCACQVHAHLERFMQGSMSAQLQIGFVQ